MARTSASARDRPRACAKCLRAVVRTLNCIVACARMLCWGVRAGRQLGSEQHCLRSLRRCFPGLLTAVRPLPTSRRSPLPLFVSLHPTTKSPPWSPASPLSPRLFSRRALTPFFFSSEGLYLVAGRVSFCYHSSAPCNNHRRRPTSGCGGSQRQGTGARAPARGCGCEGAGIDRIHRTLARAQRDARIGHL